MQAAIDILIISAMTVVVSVFLFGYMSSRNRSGLPWDTRSVTDDMLVVGSIMVLLSLFLFRWWQNTA
jgi:Na+/alanine symporter